MVELFNNRQEETEEERRKRLELEKAGFTPVRIVPDKEEPKEFTPVREVPTEIPLEKFTPVKEVQQVAPTLTKRIYPPIVEKPLPPQAPPQKPTFGVPTERELRMAETRIPEKEKLKQNIIEKAGSQLDPFVRFGKSFQAGFFGGTAHMARVLDNASITLSTLAEKKLGIPKEKLRGGIFGILADKWEYFSEKLKKEGARGIEGEVMAGLGQAVPDIAAIMTLGGYGMPVYGAVMGAAEDGLEGAVEGGVRGMVMHKAIQSIGLLPSAVRLPSWAGLGVAISPGGVEDKVAGGITWTVLGMAGGHKRLTVGEFVKNYPRVADKISDATALGMVRKLATGLTPKEIAEAGGAKIVLADIVRQLSRGDAGIQIRKEMQAKGRLKKLAPEITKEQIEKAGGVEKTLEEEIRKTIVFEEPTAKKRIEPEFVKPVEAKRIKTYPGFPKDAPDMWHEIMARGGISRPKFEVEEFESGVPKQLRRREGMKPDDMAARLGLESEKEMYVQLERAMVERVPEKPTEEIRLEYERYMEKEKYFKAEEDILDRTGYKEADIREFRDHEFLDGGELKRIATDVVEGRITKDRAVAEVKDLIRTVVGEELPTRPVAEEKLLEKQAVQFPTREEAMRKSLEAEFKGVERRVKPRPPVSEVLKEAYTRIAYKAPLLAEHKRALDEAGIKQREIEKLRRFPEELPEETALKKTITAPREKIDITDTSVTFTGLPLPKVERTKGQRVLDVLQVEPQFKRIGAPETGLALKTIHSKVNGELERAMVDVKFLSKSKVPGMEGLSKKEYRDLTFISARPGKFYTLSGANRKRFSEPYRIVRRFFDRYEGKLKDAGIIVEGYPQSAIRRMLETKEAHIRGLNRMKEFDPKQEAKIKKDMADIDMAVDFLRKTRTQYVPIPKTWMESFWEKNRGDVPTIISEFFKQRKVHDIEALSKWLVETKRIKPIDTDIRVIMTEYAHGTAKKLATADVFKAGRKEGLIRSEETAPKNWQYLDSKMFPTLKGKKVHPIFADYFEKNLVSKDFRPLKAQAILGTTKMLQFYNPIFLPMYDMVQAWWAGSVRSLKTPAHVMKAVKQMGLDPGGFAKEFKSSMKEGIGIRDSFKRGLQSMRLKDESYWDAHYWGAFSTPFTPKYENFLKDARVKIDNNPFMSTVKKHIKAPLYRLSWETAWKGDKFIRLITYNHYLTKGFSPKDSAQITAKLHADYSGVPRNTRKWLNRLFFTPTFKIAMASAQLDMIKSTGKTLYALGGKGKAPNPKDIAMSKALVGLATGILLRKGIMKALGFDEDKFSLKYTKTITTADGRKRELVLHTASPDNIFMRYFHRFTNIPTDPDAIGNWFSRVKWDLHPLYQLGVELMTNQRVSFEPVANMFDPAWKVGRDMGLYSVQRIIRILEKLEGISPSPKRQESRREFNRALGKFSTVLKWITLPYVRSPRESRVNYQMNNLIREFEKAGREKPARSEEEYQRREKRLMDKLRKLEKELEGIK